MHKFLGSVLFLLCQFSGKAQVNNWKPYGKHRMYFYWGWNRAMYTKSNLSIQGADYDLELHQIAAHDRQTPFNVNKYLRVDYMTIPQNNWRIGYFIKDNLALSFGVDHMKYVMDQNQVVDVEGQISREGKYKGVYDGPTTLTADFLTFEHTDGLNYVHFQIEKYNQFFQTKSGDVVFSGILAGGAGMLFPKTNTKFLDYERNDRFHVSGFGTGASLGLEWLFWKHLAIRGEMKAGYINMPDIVLHKEGIPGKGKQDFAYGEMFVSIAYNFGIHHSSKTK